MQHGQMRKIPLMSMSIIAAIAVAAALLIPDAQKYLPYIFSLAAVLAVLATLQLAAQILISINRLNEKIVFLDEKISAQTKILTQIETGVRLSETAKKICYRDIDRQNIRTSVLEKLHRQDFDATYNMIAELSESNEYKQLAEELKDTADKYRNSSDNERVNQVAGYVEKLLEQAQWTKAHDGIEQMIREFPAAQEKIKELQHKLIEKKEQRKRQLLDDWDKAVKKAETDRSLKILRELDLYLTPSEGLALQEAASEVFKNKLHNMGVRFSLAVSEKQWLNALEVGKDIIKEFPNSKMADEIRAKMPTLSELAKK